MNNESFHNLTKLQFKRGLRRNMTPAECALWEGLRDRRFRGTKWRRQANIDTFIADFLCTKHHLVVEVDGGIHETQKEYDKLRTEIITMRGYSVLRFSNHDVLNNLQSVLTSIEKHMNN